MIKAVAEANKILKEDEMELNIFLYISAHGVLKKIKEGKYFTDRTHVILCNKAKQIELYPIDSTASGFGSIISNVNNVNKILFSDNCRNPLNEESKEKE